MRNLKNRILKKASLSFWKRINSICHDLCFWYYVIALWRDATVFWKEIFGINGLYDFVFGCLYLKEMSLVFCCGMAFCVLRTFFLLLRWFSKVLLNSKRTVTYYSTVQLDFCLNSDKSTFKRSRQIFNLLNSCISTFPTSFHVQNFPALPSF